MLAIAFGTVGFGHFASKYLSTFFADFVALLNHKLGEIYFHF